jgi:hypothetical protein
MVAPVVYVSVKLATGGLQKSLGNMTKAIKTSFSGIKVNLGQKSINAAIKDLSMLGGVVKRISGLFFQLTKTAMLFGGAMAAAASGIMHFSAKTSDEFERSAWKFNVIFRDIKEGATDAAQRIADTFRVNLPTIQKQMAEIADVTKPLGMGNEMLVEMSKNIATLAQGAVEWTNGRYDSQRASIAMMKALVGEKEMLKEFGVVINDREIFEAIKNAGAAINPLNRAIATYNLILERTPDLQMAAFSRIESFSARFVQFKESVALLFGTLGEVFKPLATEFYNFFATLNRKLSEIMQASEGFKEFKDIANQIADAFKKISEYIENISLESFGADMTALQNAISDFARQLGDSLTNIFIAVGKALGTAIGKGIYQALTNVELGHWISDKTGYTEGKINTLRRWVKQAEEDVRRRKEGKAAAYFIHPEKSLEKWTKKLAEAEEGLAKRQTLSFGDIKSDFLKVSKEELKKLGEAADKAKTSLEGLGTGVKKVKETVDGFGGKLGFDMADAVQLTKEQILRILRLFERLENIGDSLREIENNKRYGLMEDPKERRLMERRDEINRRLEELKKSPMLGDPVAMAKWAISTIEEKKMIRAERADINKMLAARARSPEGMRDMMREQIKGLLKDRRDLTFDPTKGEAEKALDREAINAQIREVQAKLPRDRTATLTDLTGAYTSMLQRAAGKKQPEEEVRDKIEDTNELLKKQSLVEKEMAAALEKISIATGKTIPDILKQIKPDVTYTR